MEDHRGMFEALSSKMDLLLEAVNGGRTGSHNGNGRHDDGTNTEHLGVSGGIPFRSIKIEFPIFDEENPIGWLYKANHYFALHPMPDGQKILMSSFYMEGSTMVWF